MNKKNKNKNYDKNSKSPKSNKEKKNSSQGDMNSNESIKSKSGSFEFNFLDKKYRSLSNPSKKDNIFLCIKKNRDNAIQSPKSKNIPKVFSNNQQNSEDRLIEISRIDQNVSNFNVGNLKDNEISKFPDKEQIANIDDSKTTKKTITIDNFDQCMPDTLEMFLISLSKCFEINDVCVSSCLIGQTILLTFNSIYINSHDGNKTINLIKQMYEFIVKYNKNEIDTSKENLNKQENLFKEMVDFHFNVENKHQIDWTVYLEPLHLLEYVYDFIHNLKIPQKLFSNPYLFVQCDEVFRKFAVCFRRIIFSQYFEKFKNTTVKIVCAGSKGEHAEIKMTRHLVKYHPNIEEVYIATSKRPCGLCFEIINKIFHEQLKIKIKTRISSHLFFKQYVKPNFIERNAVYNVIFIEFHSNLETAYSDHTENKRKFENMDEATSFEFEKDESQFEKIISNMGKCIDEKFNKLETKFSNLETNFNNLEKKISELLNKVIIF